ncbi:trace amine-associated receptor 7e-like [Clytia hemisphaerica]|uniref:trace amine-associated receptor 7e-like n=1 Tax=Clytia hemisphaerica TaxID=252671 RepID=UPI0034D5B6F8
MSCDAIFSTSNRGFNLAATILFGLSAIITTLGNTFSLMVLWQPSQRSKSNKILTSLVISDCLVGFLSNPMAILIMWTGLEITPSICRLNTIALFFVTWFSSSSGFTILFITYDRYISITKPFKYHDIITDLKINLILVTIWVGNSITALLNAINKILFLHFLNIGFVIASTILITGYYQIWKAVKQRQTNIISLSRNDQEHLRTHIRLAKKILFLMIAYFGAALPVVVYAIVVLYDHFTRPYQPYLYVVGIFFVLFNSCVDPCIYIWKDLEFKRACKRFLRRNTAFAWLFNGGTINPIAVIS